MRISLAAAMLAIASAPILADNHVTAAWLSPSNIPTLLRGTVKPGDPTIPKTIAGPGLRPSYRLEDALSGGFWKTPKSRKKPKLPRIVWNSDGMGDQIITGAVGQWPPRANYQPYPGTDNTGQQNGISAALKLQMERLEIMAGNMIARFVPPPITNLKIIAGNYRVNIPVRP